jgi:tetratricopeptide (TPR) repeat protein
MRLVLAVLFLCAWSQASAQVTREEPPPACVANAQGEVNYEACAAATQPGTGFHWLSLMHLGMYALARQDVRTAIEYFDRAGSGDREKFFTRPRLHGYRATAYRQVGRAADALAEARVTLSLLRRNRDIPAEAYSLFDDAPLNNELAYAVILPILREANDPDYASARDEYLAIPSQDWRSLAIRAGTLEALDELEAALIVSERVIALQPNDPRVQNNHCYLLARSQRAAEGLPHCELAVTQAPEMAPFRHSYASALAGVGQCQRAEAEIAEAARLDPVSVRPEITCSSAAR